MSNKPIACLISARLQFSLYKSFNSGCSGGLSEISVDSQSRSPILRSVELVSCPAEGPEGSTSYALPDYPLEMFGGQAVWRNNGELMVCGGANWVRTSSQCYSWSGRSVNGSQWQSISVNISQYQSIRVVSIFLPEVTAAVSGLRLGGSTIPEPLVSWPTCRSQCVRKTNSLFSGE